MKIIPSACLVFFVTLISAGLVSVARWLHPATFPVTTLWLLLVIAFASATVIVLSHD